MGALALEARGQHKACRVAHVVGVRLEREPEQRDPFAGERAEPTRKLAHHPSLL
jgi:hypothetical protein